MREKFEEQLEGIRSRVLKMGSDVNEMLRVAVEATLTSDTSLAESVILMDDAIDEAELQAVTDVSLALLKESPVASDFKFLVATIGIISEFEQAGDDAVKLARRSIKLRGQFPPEMSVSLMSLSKQARKAMSGALRLYSDYDEELASFIIDHDSSIDIAYKEARNRLLDLIQENPDRSELILRSIEVFHAIEHVADRAVMIAKRLRIHYS